MSKRLRFLLFALVCLLRACTVPYAYAQYTPVAGAHVQDGSGNLLSSGQICALGVNPAGNQPISFNVGGTAGLALPENTACANVTSGVIASGYQLADSNLTHPANIAYLFTVTDNISGNSYKFGPTQVSCTIAPTPSNCSSGTWSTDGYYPSIVPIALQQYGPISSFTVGTVSTGAPGASVAITITGTPPNLVLNVTIPQGYQGLTGPADALAIGSVITGAPGGAVSATITGTAPNQVLNLTIPQGTQGIQGIQGLAGAGYIAGLTSDGANGIKVAASVAAVAMIPSVSPWADVRAYGAKCDGATDDTAAFLAALAAAQNVFIPNATCVVSSVYVPANHRMYGAGKTQSILLQKAGSTGPAVQLKMSDQNVEIGDFAVNGNGSNQTAPVSGIEVDGGSLNSNGWPLYTGNHFTLERLYVSNVSGDCFQIGGQSGVYNDLQAFNCGVGATSTSTVGRCFYAALVDSHAHEWDAGSCALEGIHIFYGSESHYDNMWAWYTGGVKSNGSCAAVGGVPQTCGAGIVVDGDDNTLNGVHAQNTGGDSLQVFGVNQTITELHAESAGSIATGGTNTNAVGVRLTANSSRVSGIVDQGKCSGVPCTGLQYALEVDNPGIVGNVVDLISVGPTGGDTSLVGGFTGGLMKSNSFVITSATSGNNAQYGSTTYPYQVRVVNSSAAVSVDSGTSSASLAPTAYAGMSPQGADSTFFGFAPGVGQQVYDAFHSAYAGRLLQVYGAGTTGGDYYLQHLGPSNTYASVMHADPSGNLTFGSGAATNTTFTGTGLYSFSGNISVAPGAEIYSYTGSNYGNIKWPTLTSTVNWTLPVIGGTFAMTSQLPGVATSTVPGLVSPDGSTITNASGAISCATATTSQAGCIMPDGSTITIVGGVISAPGAGAFPTRVATYSATVTGYVGATTIYTPTVAGSYCVMGDITLTAVGTGGALTVLVEANTNGAGTTALTGVSIASLTGLTGVGANGSINTCIHVPAGVPLQIGVNSTATGTPSANLELAVVRVL
jgi:hypothetical protein